MARKQPNTTEENRVVSATPSMQDLLKKIRTEETQERSPIVDTDPAPKYDAERVSDTRRQLLEDYRRELEALGKASARTTSRPNLYEYEDLLSEDDEPVEEETVEEEAAEEESVEEETAEEESVEEETAEEESVEEETAEEETAEEEAVEEEAVEEEPVEEETAEEESVEEEPVEEETVEEETVEEEPVEEEPVEEESVEEEPVEEEIAEEETAEEESVEEETAEEETVEEETAEEETAEEEPVEEETAEEEPVEEENAPTVRPEQRFRPVAQFRKKTARNDGARGKTDPSKQKDLYSVYDYDMAQEFGYFPVSRAETVSETNEMDVERERRVTIFTKRESSKPTEPELKRRQRAVRQTKKVRTVKEQAKNQKRIAPKAGKERGAVPSPETADVQIRMNPQKAKEIALKRLLSAGIAAVILLFWEYLPLIPGGGYMLFGVIGNTQYPYLYIGIAAAILLIDVLLLGKHFGYGFRELIYLRCTPRSLVAFAVSLTFLNDLFSCYILALDPGVGYGIFHFPAALFLLLYAVGNYSAVCRKCDAYEVFYAPRLKYILTDDALCEQIRNSVAERRSPEESSIIRFTAKSEVEGIAKRLSNEDRYDAVRLSFFLFLLFGMGTMLASAFLSWESTSMLSRISEALQIFLWTTFLVMPLAVTEIRRIPLMMASEEMRRQNTALAGDGAALEYASVTHVAIRTELFFRKYAFCFGQFLGAEQERLKYYVFSIFRSLGEPFSRAMAGIEQPERLSDNVKIISVTETIVSAYVDGVLVELRLIEIGSQGYFVFDPEAPLREFAYRLPLSITADGASIGTCSFYAQNDSEYPMLIRVLSKYLHIETEHYTFLPFFTDKTLKVSGTVPNVTNLSGYSTAERLQKQCIRTESADSGIAALGAPKDLRIPLVYARQITAYNRFAAALMWLSTVIGIAASFLVVFGLLPTEAFPLLFILLSFVFGGVTLAFSRHFISLRRWQQRTKSGANEKK